jgi:DNA end-binding protein Ku
MAARSIASLTLSFGLVSIPVKLYSATSPSAGVSFNLLHKDCGSRLKQQYVCQKEGVVVERADMVKGYEFTKDQYVIFTPDELKQLEEQGTHSIDIMAFVPTASIDPIYYDKAYYLAPDKGGARPYALLSEGMRQTGRCALARWASRGKQHIVQVRATDDGLILQQLLYAEEVRGMSELEIEKAEVKQAELELALQLINQSATDAYDPAAYQDEVKKRVETAVQEKVEGKQVTLAPEAESAGAQVIDLMEALRASLGKAPTAAAPAAEAKAAERKPPKRVPASEAAAPAAKVKARKQG